MAALDYTWMFISGQVSGESVEAKVRGELFGCCLMSLLVHTSLRSTLSEVTTASDASSTGGAVGKSVSLSKAGSQFCRVGQKWSNWGAGNTSAGAVVIQRHRLRLPVLRPLRGPTDGGHIIRAQC